MFARHFGRESHGDAVLVDAIVFGLDVRVFACKGAHILDERRLATNRAPTKRVELNLNKIENFENGKMKS